MNLFLYLLCVYLLFGLFLTVKILTNKEFHNLRANKSKKEISYFFLKVIFTWILKGRIRGSKLTFEFK